MLLSSSFFISCAILTSKGKVSPAPTALNWHVGSVTSLEKLGCAIHSEMGGPPEAFML